MRCRMLAVKTSWQRFGRPAGLFSDAEDRYGIHGGDVETSLMLWFRPDLVDMGQAAEFPSRVAAAEATFALLRHTGPGDNRERIVRIDKIRIDQNNALATPRTRRPPIASLASNERSATIS